MPKIFSKYHKIVEFANTHEKTASSNRRALALAIPFTHYEVINMAKTPKKTHAKAQAEAPATSDLGTFQIVNGRLLIDMPTVWDGISYSNKGAKDSANPLPDCERTKRIGMLSQRIELPSGQTINLGCNVTQGADVKVSVKQRQLQKIAQLERKLERIEAQNAMI